MENKLELLVKESGLEETKSQVLLKNFQDYFKIASEWEIKAKTLIVTDEKQKVEMEMARSGRLFLREKRLAIEKSRKELKEQSLREGKAIDGIANVLKGLIEPIEEYLDKQEHFVENKKKEEEERVRLEVEKKLEDERIAKEKSDREEQERIRVENQKLKAQIEEKERITNEERRKAEVEKQAIEEKARKEREDAENAKLKAQEKADAEKKKLQDKQKKLEEELKAQIECPNCHHKFNIK